MRSLISILVLVACVCTMAIAADTGVGGAAPSKGTEDLKSPPVLKPRPEVQPINNISNVEADKSLIAVCVCGTKFKVTDKALSIKNGETLLYCCSKECHEKALTMSETEKKAALENWSTSFSALKFATNVSAKDGKNMAVCGCGKTFECTEKSPVLWENGMKVCCCSDACHASMLKMSEADRLSATLKLIGSQSVAPADAK